MKYKKKVENLKRAQAWFDSLKESEKSALTRPGSVKCFSTFTQRRK